MLLTLILAGPLQAGGRQASEGGAVLSPVPRDGWPSRVESRIRRLVGESLHSERIEAAVRAWLVGGEEVLLEMRLPPTLKDQALEDRAGEIYDILAARITAEFPSISISPDSTWRVDGPQPAAIAVRDESPLRRRVRLQTPGSL